jgi:hypothetical protein
MMGSAPLLRNNSVNALLRGGLPLGLPLWPGFQLAGVAMLFVIFAVPAVYQHICSITLHDFNHPVN